VASARRCGRHRDGGSKHARPMPAGAVRPLGRGEVSFQASHGVAGRATGTRLPAGISLNSCLPALCFRRSGERAEGTRLPAGFSLTSCLPGACFTSCLPGACFTSCLPGSASPPACRGPASPPACRGPASPPACRGPASPPARRGRRLYGADRQPLASRLLDRPLHATEPARRAHACQRGTSCRSEKNPPLTHGDPAEAGPPGQSQPSRVHPVKQQAGAMRTRTGARPSSTSCASPIAWTYGQLRDAAGGGRHPVFTCRAPIFAVFPGQYCEVAGRHPNMAAATSHADPSALLPRPAKQPLNGLWPNLTASMLGHQAGPLPREARVLAPEAGLLGIRGRPPGSRGSRPSSPSRNCRR